MAEAGRGARCNGQVAFITGGAGNRRHLCAPAYARGCEHRDCRREQGGTPQLAAPIKNLSITST